MSERKWFPELGWSDLADLIIHEVLCDFPELLRDPREVAHVTCAAAALMGLAQHAALGKEKPVFVEIGTQIGISTRCLLLMAERYDGHVTSMDIDPTCGDGPTKAWAEKRGLLKRWTFLCGPSQSAPTQPADFLLVDGDHGYEAVCADMALHGCAAKNGAIIVLDDYHVTFLGKMRWTQERWRELSPVTQGPFAVLMKLPGDEETYRKVFPGDSWDWKLR